MGQEAARDAGVVFHRSEIAVTVLPADRQACDEVVKDEVVQDDDAGSTSQCVDDPTVRFWIVADVVERNVRGHGPRATAPHHGKVDQPLERGEQQRGVIGYPGPFRG